MVWDWIWKQIVGVGITGSGSGRDDFKTMGKSKAVVEVKPDSSHVSLNLAESPIEFLPEGVSVQFTLNLRNCHRLTQLPDGLRAGSLILSGCTSLKRLPENMDVSFLDLSGCFEIEAWPERGKLEAGRLRMRDCPQFRTLPSWVKSISQLDLAGCVRMEHLPEDLHVGSWIDVADTALTGLPECLRGVGLRWRGVRIDERIAFHPEEITALEVLKETNSEVRRVKMERMGLDRFMEEANAEILDTDQAPGGERRLLRVAIPDDEPLVCVSVGCPSTDRRYLLRVPPETPTCRHAVAWTAGFDNPNDYNPLIET